MPARTRLRADRGAKAVLDRLRVAPALQLLEREGLHGLDGIERLIDQAAGIGDPILRRARQPSHPPPDQIRIGTITSGISTRITAVRRALVSASMTSAPIRLSTERSVIDRLTPAIACTSVVSAVRRDSTSPVRVTSKKVGSMRTTRR